MPRRGTHYERAFASYLQQRQIPYVAVDQAKKAVFSGAKIKSFDFILYPQKGPKILADVKGRKVASQSFLRGRAAESWTTRQDVSGLQDWEEVFGYEYLAAFIFAYWLTNIPPKEYDIQDPLGQNPKTNALFTNGLQQKCGTNPNSNAIPDEKMIPSRPQSESLQPGLFDDVFRYQQRDYAFWVMELSGYRLRMKQRSPKWETVYVPRKSFRESAQPFMEFIQGPQTSKRSHKANNNN
jgi:hypothetical protein